MDFVNDILKQIANLGPEALVGASVIVVGYVLRVVKPFPNRFIPLACFVAGAVLYPLLVNTPVDSAVRHPIVKQSLVGLLVGCIAWLGHNKILKPLEDKFPFLKGFFDSLDGEKDQPPPQNDEQKR